MITDIDVKRLCPGMTATHVWEEKRLKAILIR
jgi:short-subunit dehydrogenase